MVPVPPRVLEAVQQQQQERAHSRKATLSELGIFYDGKREVHGWSHAAELRAVPLRVDQEQTLFNAPLHQIELARRKLGSTKHQDALEARSRPWRSGDALERDARWSGPQHRGAVATLRDNLDHMLNAWRTANEPVRRAEYEHLPERQPSAAVEQEPLPGGAPRPPAPSSNDFLYNLLLQLELMLSELRVYDSVFQRITVPSFAPGTAEDTSELGSVVCPSAPLRDLLDRIRVAHAALNPRLEELFGEVRRRLKVEWMLGEMARKKDASMDTAKERLGDWDALLTEETARSAALNDELQRTKDSLVRYSDDAFHAHRAGMDASPADGAAEEPTATLLYDTRTGRMKPVRTRGELELLRAMPTQFHGEREPDNVEEDSDEDDRDAKDKTANTQQAEEQRRRNDKLAVMQRREARRQKRAQLVLAQRAWRRRRLGQLSNLSRRPGGLTVEERGELARLQAEQVRANEAERRGEEEKVADGPDGKEHGIDSSSASDSDASEESTDSDPSVPPSAAVLRRRKRLAGMSPDERVSFVSQRLSRAVVRSFTTRPLLQIHPLVSGARQQGRVWTNSVYYTFDLAPGDAGVWVRLFAAEGGTASEHLELMLACGAPPTRRNRFVTTGTRDGATHCAIDLRDGEMGRLAKQQQEDQRRRDEADGIVTARSQELTVPGDIVPPSAAAGGLRKGTSRWFLRVLGRGLRLKHFTLELRIHTQPPLAAGAELARVLDDLELQAHWQDSLTDKALVVQHFAQETMRELLPPEQRDSEFGGEF